MTKKSSSLIMLSLRSKIFFVVLLIVFSFSLWSLINEVGRRQKIRQEIDKQRQAINRLETENKDLLTLIDYLRTSQFIEQEAREKLKLSKPGESLIIINEDDPQTDNKSGESSTKIAKWWNYFFQ